MKVCIKPELFIKTDQVYRELSKRFSRRKFPKFVLVYRELTRVLQNLDFARANMKANIYDQAVLEGVAASFPQTEEIIDNGKVNGMSATDVQKILNLKHAWEFILDRDVIQSETNYHMLCHIAKLVNEGFFYDGGRIRGIPVTIGGCTYVPPIPIESVVIENINEIRSQNTNAVNIGLNCVCIA